MRKYWAIYVAQLHNFSTYRGFMVIWLLGNLVTLTVLISVLFATDSNFVNPLFNRSELIVYYIAGIFVNWVTLWHPFYDLERDIKNGSIVGQVLVKPVSLYWQYFFQELSWHTVGLFFGLIACALAAVPLLHYLTLSLTPETIILFILSLALSSILIFTISLCMGLLAFWFTHVTVIDSIFWSIRMLLAGQVIPLAFFPGSFQQIIKLLPTRYMVSFPLEILLGKISTTDTLYGFVVGIVWIGLFVLAFKHLFSKGVRAYTAFGN